MWFDVDEAGSLLLTGDGRGAAAGEEVTAAFCDEAAGGGGALDVGAGVGVVEGVAVVDGRATFTSLDDAGASCNGVAELSGPELRALEIEESDEDGTMLEDKDGELETMVTEAETHLSQRRHRHIASIRGTEREIETGIESESEKKTGTD